ncbi:protein KASH5 isoform X2 [Camarhynchus parvulus]|uniref:protein KASH5 isoform X2 n=1 Tax=Geospiza parvula TaxID=87175 RepID=UPI001237F1DB|nr:protein KASH5 isoform X2 [Camarhynchus parvulus]
MAAEVPCAPGAVIPLPAPAESGCSDEFALDCTFAACDPERTGLVQPQRVVEYVAAMTGHSGHDGRLRALQRALDPAAAGMALDWSRFRSAMGAWIAACRQEGAEEQDVAAGDTGPVSGADPRLRPCRAEEQDVATGAVPAEEEGHASPAAAQLQGDNTDATSPSAEAAGLRSRARQLAAQNAKLQRDAELAEELNARLAEEIAQLQAQLRSSRQALEQARAAVEELDDMKAVVKRLEEENTELRRQARHAEKEQRSLCSRAEGLQEEVSLALGAAPAGQCHRKPQPCFTPGRTSGSSPRARDCGSSSRRRRLGLPAWRPSSAVTLPCSLPGTQPLPRPCPTGRAEGAGADGSTGGVRADGAGIAPGDDTAAAAAGPDAGRLGHAPMVPARPAGAPGHGHGEPGKGGLRGALQGHPSH